MSNSAFGALIALSLAVGLGLYLITIRLAVGLFWVAIVVLLWLRIEVLAKAARLQEIKLVAARSALLQVAFLECRCVDNAIIIEDLMEPEKVGKSPGKGYCEVCRARAVLREHYPGAIEEKKRERQFSRFPCVPKDL